jgi:hypothetical protein
MGFNFNMNLNFIIIFLLLILFVIFLLSKKNKEKLTINEAIDDLLNEINSNIKSEFIGEIERTLENNKINEYMYFPNSSTTLFDQNIIWTNLKDYKNNGFSPMPGKSIDLTYDTNMWNNKYIYKLDSNGFEITVPTYQGNIPNTDYTVLWVQTTNDRISTFNVYNKDINPINYFGTYATGFRNLTKITPFGSVTNENWNYFDWQPVPIKLSQSRKIIINDPFAIDNILKPQNTYICGLAFSTNNWNHCSMTSLIPYLNLNQDNSLYLSRDNISYNIKTNINSNMQLLNNTQLTSDGDIITMIKFFSYISVKIPFVNSNKNKILYIITNNDDTGITISKVFVNSILIGNFYTSFNNPFSRHFNSKSYNKYLGVIIPKEILSTNNNFMTVEIQVPDELYIREIGTHDAIFI